MQVNRIALLTICMIPGVASFSNANEFAEELQENMQYQLENYIDFYAHDPAPNTTRDSNDNAAKWIGLLNMESQANISDDIIFNVGLNMHYSLRNTQRGVFSGPRNSKDNAHFIDFSDLNIIIEEDFYDIQIGKAKYEIGFSELYSVIDRFNLSDSGDPLHPVNAGAWKVKTDIYLDEWIDYEDKLTFSVLPFDTKAVNIPDDSRWRGGRGDGGFFNQTGDVIDTTRDGSIENWEFITQYDGYRESFDFSFGIQRGPNPYAVIRSEAQINNFQVQVSNYKEYVTVHSAYGGLKYNDEEWQYYGEFLAQDTLHGKDDDVLRGVIGVVYKDTDFATRIGLDEISPTLEFAREKILEEQDNDQYTVSSKDARPFRNSVLANLKFVYDSDYTLSLGSAMNFNDRDAQYSVEFEYKHDDNNYYYLRGYVFQGPENTQLGNWDANDTIVTGYLRKF